MRFFFIYILVLLTSFSLKAQIKYWYDLFSVNRLNHIVSNSDYVFAAGKNALLIYNPNEGSIDRLSAQGELSDTSISAMEMVDDIIVIGYSSGNIDVIKKQQVYNLKDIKENTLLAQNEKKINNIIAFDGYAYAATDFGVVKIDVNNDVLVNTVFFKDDYDNYITAKDLKIVKNVIYVLTERGIYFIPLSDNYLDFKNWNFINFATGQELATDGTYLYVAAYQSENTIIFKLRDNVFQQIATVSGKYGFKILDNIIYLFGDKIMKYNLSGELLDSRLTYGDNSKIFANDLILFHGNIWVADRYRGLVKEMREPIHFPTPFSDNVNYVLPHKDKVFILHKTDKLDHQYGYKGVISIITNQQKAEYLTFDTLNDFINMVIDPKDDQHWFLSCDSLGLVEVKNKKVVNIYNADNAPFTPTNGYLKITDLKFDTQGNLWMIYQSDTYPVVILRHDGTWENVEPSSVAAGKPTYYFTLTSQGFFYANMMNYGMLTIKLSTGESKLFYPYYRIGKRINYISEDKDGVIWFSTNDGLGYLTSQDFTSSDFKAVRPKVEVTLNDTVIYAYLLDNVNCIRVLVDEANRKWVAASYFGIFELAPDGLSEIDHFNVYNGKLITNFIKDVAYNKQTGQIYFNTDQGIIVYRSDAPAAQPDFSNVKIYPNPVRPNYNGPITITGLVAYTIVKIVDLEGNLVYEGRSTGGAFVWDGRTLDGREPHSGVYLILCTDDRGLNKCVKKLLIVR